MAILEPAPAASGPWPWRFFVMGLALGALVMHALRPPIEVRVVRLRVLDGGQARADLGSP